MNIQRKKEPMRLPIFFLALSLILAACAAPPKDSSPTAPPVKIEPTVVPVKPTVAPTGALTKAGFEDSLLAVEWKGRPEGSLLFPLDPATGTALPGYDPISLGQSYISAFSPDRRTLAAMTYLNDQATRGNLLLIDLESWKTRQLELKPNGWASAMVFSPDGKQLAIADGLSSYRLTIFNLDKGIITAQKEQDILTTRLKFTTDSQALMLYGMMLQNRFTENEMSGGPALVRLLDARDLTPRWSLELKSVRDGIYPTDEKVTPDMSQPGTAMYLSPAVVFAPDQNTLYITHADSDRLTIVDFDAQNFETLEIEAELSWFERLLSLTAGVAHAKVADGTSKQAAVSPDGQFLYVIGMRSEAVPAKDGNWDIKQIPLGLEIIRTSDGGRAERFETQANDLSLSTDGNLLYLRNWTTNTPWTEIFDTSTHQIITRRTGIYGMPALRMNGESLLASTTSTSNTSNHMSVLQPDGSQLLSEWTSSTYVAFLTP
jgi:sugar lactone lactonase YvrE